jgi:NADH:ubiquinone oxidoreductase subunit E
LYGHIPNEAAVEIGQRLKIPPADIYGVIEFYEMFYSHPAGKKIIKVCTDLTCGMAGGELVLNEVCKHLDIAPNTNTTDGEYRIEHAPCLGICDQAPVVHAGNQVIVNPDPAE